MGENWYLKGKNGQFIKWLKYGFSQNRPVFRAIFDLSNKIALLILLRMYALYVKKKEQKIENWLKSDIFSSV